MPEFVSELVKGNLSHLKPVIFNIGTSQRARGGKISLLQYNVMQYNQYNNSQFNRITASSIIEVTADSPNQLRCLDS
jgi:hypothetical protein